ncbi:MAG: M48 family metallopeptidase [Eggerthellaceae bacterium]|nr:M48 family metallopeptidase [Eggerthellaceae bacterium]
MRLNVDGIEVNFTPKNVKRINLRVKRPDGHVEASAPIGMDVAKVEAFIRKEKAWIKRCQAQIAQRAAQGSGSGDGGDAGDKGKRGLRNAHAPGVSATPEELAAWRKSVAEATEKWLAVWEPVIGVKAKSLVFRDMTSRWGSCNTKTARICINIRLANYPPECLEYVVVHELCHLLQRGHNAEFWGYVGMCIPDWKRRRAILRQR